MHLTRPFVEPDLAALKALVDRTIEACYTPMYPPAAVAFFKEHHSEDAILADARAGHTLVIAEGKALLATGTLLGTTIRRMFVDPARQGQGLGGALLNNLEEYARGAGLAELDLHASLPARDFYLRHGYELLSEEAMPLPDSEELRFYAMRKVLTGVVTDALETPAGSLALLRVGPQELDRILALMQEASDWLQSRGIRQWRRVFTEEGRAFVAARFATDDVYLVLRQGEPVASFTLRWEEPTMWEEAGFDGQAGYLHGFVVSRQVGGQGVGKALMAWMDRQIAARGRRYLRLNTALGNPGICGYYERAGFLPRGEALHALGGTTRLYEREVDAEVDSP